MTDFALRLDRLCEASGKMRKDIAREIYVSQSTLSSYTSGRCEPSIMVLSRLADVLGVSTDELLGRGEKQ